MWSIRWRCGWCVRFVFQSVLASFPIDATVHSHHIIIYYWVNRIVSLSRAACALARPHNKAILTMYATTCYVHTSNQFWYASAIAVARPSQTIVVQMNLVGNLDFQIGCTNTMQLIKMYMVASVSAVRPSRVRCDVCQPRRACGTQNGWTKALHTMWYIFLIARSLVLVPWR